MSRISAMLTLAGGWFLVACTPPAQSPTEPWEAVISVPPERSVCGWEELTAEDAVLSIGQDDVRVAPGASVAIIAPVAGASYGDVKAALEPAENSLVRVKFAPEAKWLLAATFPQRHRQPKKPPKEHRATRVVGRRKITRDVRRPAERFAALRVDGDRVWLFVENDAQKGTELAIVELRSALSNLDPHADTFALTATDTSPWHHVQTAMVAAACYDRGPGDEPHEVILD